MRKFFLLISISLIITACLCYKQANAELETTTTLIPTTSMLVCCEYQGYNLPSSLSDKFTNPILDIMEMSVPTERFIETEDDCLNGTGRRDRAGIVIPIARCGEVCSNFPDLDRCGSCCDMVYSSEYLLTERLNCRSMCSLALPPTLPQSLCTFDSECRAGLSCINGRCTLPAFETTSIEQPIIKTPSEILNTNSQPITVPVSHPQPCTFNADCQTGFTCVNSKCSQ